MSEVGLVAATLPLQRQQEVPPVPDAASLIFIDHVDEQEGQNPDVAVRQLGADDVEHVVEGVEAVGAVRCLLGPRLAAASGRGAGGGAPAVHPPAAAARPAGHGPALHGTAWNIALTRVQLVRLQVRRGDESAGEVWLL